MSDYYEPIMPEGHKLGSSKKNTDAFSGNSFDESGKLGRPDWRRVENSDVGQDGSDLIKLLIGAAVGAVTTIVAVKMVPYFKTKLTKRKASRQNLTVQTPESGSIALSAIASQDFSSQVEVALDERIVMSSAEAQERFLALFMAAAFIAEQIRVLSDARIEDGVIPELERAMSKLSAPSVTETINRILQADTSLLDEATSAQFIEIFGGGRVVAGHYVPVPHDRIQTALRLTVD